MSIDVYKQNCECLLTKKAWHVFQKDFELFQSSLCQSSLFGNCCYV